MSDRALGGGQMGREAGTGLWASPSAYAAVAILGSDHTCEFVEDDWNGEGGECLVPSS